jgi:DNA-binding transcriptional ArsR family regulator
MLEELKLPERSSISVFDAALGLRITNARYRADAEVTELTASRDLKRLTDAGLLIPIGERRGRIYKGSDFLTNIRRGTRQPRPLDNPYDLVARRADAHSEPRLPGL